jgi:hypothetical protein
MAGRQGSWVWLLLALAASFGGAVFAGITVAHLAVEPGYHHVPKTWFDNDIAMALPVPVIVIHITGNLRIIAIAIITVCVVSFAATRFAGTVAIRRFALPKLLAGQFCIGIALACFPIAISSDAYAYMLFGREFGLHGINPYASPHAFLTAGGDAQLARLLALFGNPLPWGDEYGPLFTLWAGAVARMFGTSLGLAYVVQRIAVMSAAVAVSAGLFVLLRRQDDVVRRVGRFAFHPLVLLETAINGHNDMLMVAFAVGAFAFAEDVPILAGLCIGAAIGIKVVAIVVVPFVFAIAARRGILRGVAVAAAAMAILALSYLPFWTGWRTIAAFAEKGHQQAFSPAYLISTVVLGPNFDERFTTAALPALRAVPVFGHATWPQLIEYALLASFAIVAVVVFVRFIRTRSINNLWIAMVAFVWAAPVLNPWYLVWLSPMIAWPGYWPRYARLAMFAALSYYPLLYGVANGDFSGVLTVAATLTVVVLPLIVAALWSSTAEYRGALEHDRIREHAIDERTIFFK